MTAPAILDNESVATYVQRVSKSPYGYLVLKNVRLKILKGLWYEWLLLMPLTYALTSYWFAAFVYAGLGACCLLLAAIVGAAPLAVKETLRRDYERSKQRDAGRGIL
jgi:hypothetical protein